MLNKSYQELFKNPVSLKRNIKKIIIDIDERLKLDRDKLRLDEKKASQDYEIKNKQLKKKPVTSK